jgi:hypothetical protein
MELLFNIVWLLIALGAVSLWCIDCASRKCQRSRKLVRERIALVCVLVLVFFVVSFSDDVQALNDDLRGVATLSDDSTTERRHSAVWDYSHGSHQTAERPHASPATVAPRLLLSPNLQLAERILPATVHLYREAQQSSLFGRSPPSPFHF